MNKITIIAIGAAAGAIGFAIGQYKKRKDISDKLDVALKDIEYATDVEVKEAVVEAGVKRAVDNVVMAEVTKAAKEIASKAAAECRSEMKETIRKKLEDSISDKELEKLKGEVLNKVSDRASRKITDGLEYIFDDFRRQLRRMSSLT